MQWFNKKSQPVWTALKSFNDSILLAKVRKGDNKPLVEIAAIEVGNPRHKETLKAISAKYKLKKERCTFVLGLSDYQLIQVETPNVPKNEQVSAVRWKLKDMIDYPVEEATIDLLDIPQDPANQNKQSYVYAVAAKHSVLGPLANAFVDAGLSLSAIDVRVTAQRNIAAYLEQPERGLALLNVGGNGALLTFTHAGELYHARSFLDIEEVLSTGAIERIALELQRSLDHFDRQFPFITVNKLLVAPFEGCDALVAHLRTALYIPVEGFALSDVFDFSEQVNLGDLAMQSRMFSVLGAALREEAIA